MAPGVSSMNVQPGAHPGYWFPATCSTTTPAPLSSPVYFTGLVPAAIFPVGGAIPALILGERTVRGSRKRRAFPLYIPSSLDTRPSPAPQSYLAVLPFLCVHPDGLVVPWGAKGGCHQPALWAFPGWAEHKMGQGRGRG